MRATRADLPRLHELLDSPAKPNRRRAYVRDFEAAIAVDPLRLRRFEAIEADLAGLDALAWSHLKTLVAGRFAQAAPQHGWQQAFDILNEAKAYRYLVDLGCTEVMFLPAGMTKMPDLQARDGAKRVLCEVKTIIASMRATFWKKLATRLTDARMQIDAFSPDSNSRRIIYVVLMLDAIQPAQRAAFLADVRIYAANLPAWQGEIVVAAAATGHGPDHMPDVIQLIGDSSISR